MRRNAAFAGAVGLINKYHGVMNKKHIEIPSDGSYNDTYKRRHFLIRNRTEKGGLCGKDDDLARMWLSFVRQEESDSMSPDLLMKQTDTCLSRSVRERSIRKMMMDETDYRELFAELEHYEREGVDITLNGYRVSPLQIVTAYMTKEEGTYMRDYDISCEGYVEALRFTDINQHDRTEDTP